MACGARIGWVSSLCEEFLERKKRELQQKRDESEQARCARVQIHQTLESYSGEALREPRKGPDVAGDEGARRVQVGARGDQRRVREAEGGQRQAGELRSMEGC